MEVYIGLDVSLASTAVCVLGEKGKMVTEAQVASAPESLVAFMRDLPHEIAAIGLEAGPLSHWLHKGLTDAGFEAVLDGDPAGEVGTEGDADQDGPPGCRRHCPAFADGLVPAGALQDGLVAGDACAPDLAQVRAERADQSWSSRCAASCATSA